MKGGIKSAFRGTPEDYVLRTLADDINTHGVLAECHQYSHADDVVALRSSLELLGLMGDKVPSWVTGPDVDLTLYESRLSEARSIAMVTKDFSQVDSLKAAFVAAGLEVRMSKAGVELVPGAGFDLSKLETL